MKNWKPLYENVFIGEEYAYYIVNSRQTVVYLFGENNHNFKIDFGIAVIRTLNYGGLRGLLNCYDEIMEYYSKEGSSSCLFELQDEKFKNGLKNNVNCLNKHYLVVVDPLTYIEVVTLGDNSLEPIIDTLSDKEAVEIMAKLEELK